MFCRVNDRTSEFVNALYAKSLEFVFSVSAHSVEKSRISDIRSAENAAHE